MLISGFGRRGHAVASSEWMQKSEGYHRPHYVCPSDIKPKIIERSSVHEVGDIPGVRFKVVKAECHYFQELMCVMVCFSMVFPRAFRAHEMMISDEMDGQCTAPGGRLWPGCLVQEQEGHSFCDCCQDTILDPMLSWTCFQEKPRS